MRKAALLFATLLSFAPLHAASRRHIAGRGGADPVFGVFINVPARPDATEIGRSLDLAAADGIGWVRIPFTWSAIQPTSAGLNILLHSPIVKRAAADNLRVVGMLGFSTTWNTTAPATETRAAQREHYPPADYDAWYRYVLTVVTVFKDSVHYWEVWNSPDVGSVTPPGQVCNGSWCGSAAQYAHLLSVAYKAVKTADPAASVIMGGMSLSSDTDTNFLYDVLADPDFPGRDAFDIMGFHAYGTKTEALRRMNFVKSQLAFGGAGTLPIWVTEFGYPSDPALQTVPPFFDGDSAQAAYLKDMAAYLILIGARKVFWYQMFDTAGDAPPAYGLLTSTFVKKQSYTAYGEFISSYHP